MKKVAIVCLAWILIIIVATPSLASTEYAVPNSSIIVGFSGDVGINVSHSMQTPSIGSRVYRDNFNITWFISPFESPDGKIDIIIVPVEKPGFWEWLLPWI